MSINTWGSINTWASAPKEVLLGTINSTISMHEPTVTQGKVIVLNAIQSTLTVFPLSVIGGAVDNEVIKIYPAEGFGAHIRSVTELAQAVKTLTDRVSTLERGG